MEKVGFAACSTDIEGCCCLDLLSNCGGNTGGGCLAPLCEGVVSSSGSFDVDVTFDVAVCGLDRVLEASSFTGGVGAAGSSTGSAPSGPRGPAESSRLSRVVDCVILTWRRGPRDFEGAGLAETGDGELVDSGTVASGREGCSTLSVSTLAMLSHGIRSGYQLPVHCLLLPWQGCGLSRIAKGRLRLDVSLMVAVDAVWQRVDWLTVPG
jgi:hypothetical protein